MGPGELNSPPFGVWVDTVTTEHTSQAWFVFVFFQLKYFNFVLSPMICDPLGFQGEYCYLQHIYK